MPDFNDLVPKDDIRANLRYRDRLLMRCERDLGFRAAVREAAKLDILFFLNALFWLHETRPRKTADGRDLPSLIPFVTWPHQDPAILMIREQLGKCDIGVEKSRAEGMSWIMLAMAIHDWLFRPECLVGLVSSTEDKSDSAKLGSLLGKVDWELRKLPPWLVGVKGSMSNRTCDWARNHRDHSFVNFRNESQICAYAATGDVGRADRFLWFGFDELASNDWQVSNNDDKALESVRGSTDSRLFVSTPNGTRGAYYALMHNDSNMQKQRLEWRDNPTKNRGLYRFVKEGIVAVDPVKNPLLPHYNPPSAMVVDRWSRLRKYGFDLTKHTRSDYYDWECDRAGSTPQSIAKELDLDYGGTMRHVFPTEIVRIATESVQKPTSRGEFAVNDERKHEFEYSETGPFLLWTTLDAQRNPPEGLYVACCDLAAGHAGSHSSNSSLVVVDMTSRSQVAEFCSNAIPPELFAEIAVAVCKWFHGAFLNWEHMGPGTAFTSQIKRIGYKNCYSRDEDWMFKSKTRKKSRQALGFVTTRAGSKEKMFGDLREAIRRDELFIRSQAMVDEFSHYVFGESGRIENALVRTASEISHGDRVIAIAGAVLAMRRRPLPAKSDKKAKDWDPNSPPPYGTLAYRNWEHEQLAARSSDDWDDRSTADLAKPADRGHAVLGIW